MEKGRRNLEAILSASITSALAPTSLGNDGAAFHDAMRDLSARSFRAYRALVYETPEFAPYFSAATPLAEIAKLNIGSRPAARTSGGVARIEDLRAIPWVFSWAQSRVMLPGWFGLGAAVEGFLAQRGDAGLALLRRMAASWPFFRSVLNNAALVLAKSDMGVAARLAELVPDARVRAKVWGALEAEHARSVRSLLAVLEQGALLEDEPELARSIRRRAAYLDPLNHIQVELLRAVRDGKATDERSQRAIHLTVNGIAAGLRNSG